jgi:hypothetical protein
METGMTSPILQDVREFLSHSGYNDDEIERVLDGQTASAQQMAQDSLNRKVKRAPDNEVPADFYDARERFNERIMAVELLSDPISPNLYNQMWKLYLEGWSDAVEIKQLDQRAWIWRGVLMVTVPAVAIAALAMIIYYITGCVPV